MIYIQRIWLSTVFLFSVLALSSQEGLNRYSRPLMGTEVNIVLYGEKDSTDLWWQFAFAEMERINKIFSNYIDDSEVSRINNGEGWQAISTEMAELIAFSELMNQFANKAYDIKIGKAIDLWKKAIKEERLPDSKELKKIKRSKVKLDFKEYKGQFFVKLGRHTKLDFGAIAKGYAVDKAFEVLVGYGLAYILIDAGGDIRLGKSPPGKKGWKISIYNEADEVLYLENCAIATSGNSYQFMEIGDQVYTHIIDPRTMDASTFDRGVTVIAETCKFADAISTALFINSTDHQIRSKIDYKARIMDKGKYLVKDF